MTAEADLRRYRAEANKVRTDIARASSTVAAQRKKAAVASAAASKSNSTATVRTKLSDAERATKAANDAEQKRAGLEKRLADIESKIGKAQESYEKEQRASQERAIKSLSRKADQAASQFSPSSLSRHGYAMAPPRVAGDQPDSAPSSSSLAADVFLSHASEDKDDIARPLKDALEARRITVWFDELQIKVGQSIRQRIEERIAQCRFGIVIISPNFLQKQWTQAELDALFSKKMDSGNDLVLPVWHHISKDEVSRRSPLLAGILALNSATMTIEEMADALADVIL